MKKFLLILSLLAVFKSGFSQQSSTVIQQSERWFKGQNASYVKKLTPTNCEKMDIIWDKAEQIYTEGKEYIRVPVDAIYKATGKPSKEVPPAPQSNLYLVKSEVDSTFECLFVKVQSNPVKHQNMITVLDGVKGEFLVKPFDDILPLPKVNWYFEQPRE
ncbi:hypothetical protein C3K47_14235 [Solitalea longa]|uniref:Uncharacterized protein n=1 Tax=Solitalea longa TaxID=2079460 RepID=A0A2S4ZYZ1_9SPHI|nr:hypothetical protein [Solitalea longa]POY35551.1 hypothetical protein C3K47_14235 [Solitalea longa]